MKSLILFLLLTVTAIAQTTPFQAGQTSRFVNGTVTPFYVITRNDITSGEISALWLDNNYNDQSGSGNSGAAVGSPTFTTGQNGNANSAISLDGTTFG